MRSVEELKTVEDSVRFAHLPSDRLRIDVARMLAALPENYRRIILLRRARAAARTQLTASRDVVPSPRKAAP